MTRRMVAFPPALLFLLVTSPAFSSAPDTLWTCMAGGGVAFGVTELSGGGFLATGYGWQDPGPRDEIRLLRTDPNGAIMWDRIYDRTTPYGHGSGRRVFETDDGGFLLAAMEPRPSSRALRLIKTDSAGDTLWTRLWDDGGSDEYYLQDALKLPDGKVVMVGGMYYAFLSRFDTSGNREWERWFSLGSTMEVAALDRTPDGGYVLAGSFRDEPELEDHGFLLRTDSSGVEVWTREYRLEGYQFIDAVRALPDGGFVFSGTSNDSLWVVRTNAAGDSLWSRLFGQDYVGHDLRILNDGFLLAATCSGSRYYYDLDLIKLDPDGNTLWNRQVGTIYDDEGLNLALTADGGCIVAGYAYYSGCWFGGCGEYHPWLVRFAPEAISAAPEDRPVRQLSEVRVCPNPSRGPTEIRYHLENAGPVELALFDVSGRLLRILDAGPRPAGTHSLPLDVADLASGLYWIRLEIAGEKITTRLVLSR
jgi:hypothetical protein